MRGTELVEVQAQFTSPEHPQDRSGWLSTRRFGLLLAALVFLAFPAVVLGFRTFVFRDFGLFSYPVASFARESLRQGQLPLWNPLNYCGVPFLAQWNTMVLYPPTLIYLLFPLSWGLSFFCLLHLFWGGLGAYLLARRWTGFPLAGGLAGILFAFNGLNLSFLMWPSHVATFSWVPWVLGLGIEGYRKGGHRLGWAILAAAMQMLAGGPETILVTWLLLALVATGDFLSSGRPGEQAEHQSRARTDRKSAIHQATNLRNESMRWDIVRRLAWMGLLVFLLCAAQLLPFLELLKHSQRDTGYAASTHDWSMPVWGWANFLVPLFRTTPTAQGVYLQNLQYWTTSYYVGIGSVWLSLVAVWRAREWRVRLLSGICFLALVLAWGNTSVLFSVLQHCFPGLGFVRYPVKFVIVTSALLPLLAANGFSALVCQRRQLGDFEWLSALFLLALVGVIVALDKSAGTEIWRVTWRNGLGRAIFLMLEVLAAALCVREKAPGPQAILRGALILGVFYVDLFTHVPNQNPTVSPAVYAADWAKHQVGWTGEEEPTGQRAMVSPAAREYLSHNPLADVAQNQFRNRLALRADANLLDHLSIVDGFFSVLPREAWRVNNLIYQSSAQPNPALLDFLCVSRTTTPGTQTEWSIRPSALPLITAGQQPIFADDNTAFTALSKTNFNPAEFAYLPEEAREKISVTRQASASVAQIRAGNQRIEFQCESPGPSLVVLSQTFYPAWKASIDGHPTRIWRANYGFQAIQVPNGVHTVSLRYEDRSLLVGALLSGLGVILWTAFGIRTRPR